MLKVLWHERYAYNTHHHDDTKTIWRCRYKNCMERVSTSDEGLYYLKEHIMIRIIKKMRVDF